MRYHDKASGREVITANEIRIPAGRPVYLGLTTSDVIHSLWVPALEYMRKALQAGGAQIPLPYPPTGKANGATLLRLGGHQIAVSIFSISIS